MTSGRLLKTSVAIQAVTTSVVRVSGAPAVSCLLTSCSDDKFSMPFLPNAFPMAK